MPTHVLKSPIRKRLQPKDLNIIQHIEDQVRNLWANGNLHHPFFSLHGPSHLASVEAILGDLLAADHDKDNTCPLRKSLSETELFLLVASAWLHNIGMIVPMTEEERTAASQLDMEEAEYARSHYHTRTRDYIKGHTAQLHLDAASAAAISEVCEPLRKSKLFNLPYGSPNIRFLSALLRTAVALDVGNTRAPIEWLRLNWDSMDAESRWHWVKHCVVTGSTHEHHLAKDTKPPLWELSYFYIFTLPEPAVLPQLLIELLRPVRRVLDDEEGELLLARHGICVRVDQFRAAPVPCTDSEFGIPVKDTLDAFYREDLVPAAIGDGLRKAYGNHNELQLLLRRQAERVFRLIGGSDDLKSFITAQVSSLLEGVAAHADTASVETLMEQMKTAASEAWRDRSAHAVDCEPLKLEFNILTELVWRTHLFVRGEVDVQCSQLRYLVTSVGAAATGLCAHLVTTSTYTSVRAEAIRCLQSVGDSSSSHVLMSASKSDDPELRKAAIEALVRLRPPGLFTRLGQILDGDVDAPLRKIVQEALTTIFNPSEYTPFLKGRKVLIIDPDQTNVVPLAEFLTHVGATPKAITGKRQLEDILGDNPVVDVVVCSIDPAAGSPPKDAEGLDCLRLLRQRYAKTIGVIAVSNEDIEPLKAILAPFDVVFVRRPASAEDLARRIRALVPATEPNPLGTEAQSLGPRQLTQHRNPSHRIVSPQLEISHSFRGAKSPEDFLTANALLEPQSLSPVSQPSLTISVPGIHVPLQLRLAVPEDTQHLALLAAYPSGAVRSLPAIIRRVAKDRVEALITDPLFLLDPDDETMPQQQIDDFNAMVKIVAVMIEPNEP